MHLQCFPCFFSSSLWFGLISDSADHQRVDDPGPSTGVWKLHEHQTGENMGRSSQVRLRRGCSIAEVRALPQPEASTGKSRHATIDAISKMGARPC